MATLNDIETKIQSIITILKSRIVKTISGVLPLTFTANAGNVVDWSIDGNADGIGELTKNIIDLPSEAQTRDGATITFDRQKGTAILNGDTSEAESGFSIVIFDTSSLSAGEYNFSGGSDGGSSTTYDLYLYNRTQSTVLGRLYSSSDTITVTIEAGSRYTVYVQCRRGQTYNNIVFKPMIRLAGTTTDFIPYGYQIPITISQTGQTMKNYDIFIGDSQLTEGESVSKISTGVDIELFEGENTVTTTLYNKPEMTIKYNGGN